MHKAQEGGVALHTLVGMIHAPQPTMDKYPSVTTTQGERSEHLPHEDNQPSDTSHTALTKTSFSLSHFFSKSERSLNETDNDNENTSRIRS